MEIQEKTMGVRDDIPCSNLFKLHLRRHMVNVNCGCLTWMHSIYGMSFCAVQPIGMQLNILVLVKTSGKMSNRNISVFHCRRLPFSSLAPFLPCCL